MAEMQSRARDTDPAGEEQNGRVDPATDPVAEISSRMRRMLEATSGFTVGRLTKLRDRVDDVMRQHQARERELLEEIERYAADCTQTVTCEQVMSEALDELVEQIGRRVPSTVTALRPRERART